MTAVRASGVGAGATHDALAGRAPCAAGRACAGPVRARHIATLLGMVAAAWAGFSWALVAQHRAYHSNAFDLGFFDQIVWNTAHGRPFETSFLAYNFLGQHFEPVLLLFAAAFRAWPNVELLLLTQAALAAWAAVPLFLAARRLLTSATAGLLVAAAYLLAPHLHGAVLFDFHPEVMAATGIFGTFALLVAGRPVWATIALATVFLLKEDAALAAIGFALFFWLRGYRRWAAGIVAGSLLYLLLVAGVLMPALRNGSGDLQERYGYLGDDATGVVLGGLRRPDIVARQLFAPAQARGLLYLLGTEAFLPLTTPAGIAAVPLVAANLLSTHPPQHDLTLHYPILSFDLLLVATVLGAGAVATSPRWRRLRRTCRLTRGQAAVVVAALLFGAEAAGWLVGSPLGPVRFDAARYRLTAHTAVVDRALALVPSGAPVSAQSGLLPHLSQRRQVWEFPSLENAEFVIVDTSAWRSSQSTDAGYDPVLRRLPALGFCLVHDEDHVRIYARVSPCASPS